MPDVHVIGVVPDDPSAEQVIGNLRIAGFPQQACSVIRVRREEAGALEHVDDQSGEGSAETAISAAKGAAIGAGIGLLGGAATLAIPDLKVLSPIILLALFGGTGAFVGTLSGAFASEDVSDEIINRYGMALREGQSVVAVTAPDGNAAKRAEEVLRATGARNVMSYMSNESPLTAADDLTEAVK